MRLFRTSVLLLAALMPVALEAQRADPVYASAYESLLLVDVAAGSVVTVMPLPLPARVFIAFDEARQEMLYITGENAGQQLVALHIASQTVTAVPIQVTDTLYAAQYDSLTDAVFGLTNAPADLSSAFTVTALPTSSWPRERSIRCSSARPAAMTWPGIGTSSSMTSFPRRN